MNTSRTFVPCSPARLIDKIYINLMENGRYGKDKLQNKYVDQFEEIFQRLVVGSESFKISFKDFDEETTAYIEDETKDCKTLGKKYQKLNGIIPEVIERIANQARHRILAKSTSEDQILLITQLNSVRELASNHWRFIE